MTAFIDTLARSIWTTLASMVVLGCLAVGAGIAFRLSLAGSIGLYFVVWWTLLFAILPVRIRTQSDLGTTVEGTDPGAPDTPALRERAIWTSLLSSIVFAVVAVLFPLAGL